jgi:hypothetical protein
VRRDEGGTDAVRSGVVDAIVLVALAVALLAFRRRRMLPAMTDL